MSNTTKLSRSEVHHIAQLAKIRITDKEEEKLTKGFNEVLEVVNKLLEVNVKGVEPTYQVTNLKNVFRSDEIDNSRMLTQEEALSNAKRKHNGYFVVDQVLEG